MIYWQLFLRRFLQISYNACARCTPGGSIKWFSISDDFLYGLLLLKSLIIRWCLKFCNLYAWQNIITISCFHEVGYVEQLIRTSKIIIIRGTEVGTRGTRRTSDACRYTPRAIVFFFLIWKYEPSRLSMISIQREVQLVWLLLNLKISYGKTQQVKKKMFRNRICSIQKICFNQK